MVKCFLFRDYTFSVSSNLICESMNVFFVKHMSLFVDGDSFSSVFDKHVKNQPYNSFVYASFSQKEKFLHRMSSPLRQHIQWMRKSNNSDTLQSESEEWKWYSDVETAIIEEGFQDKLSNILLDDYHIDLKCFLEISNRDENIQTTVKRVQHEPVEEGRLRATRLMPNPVLPSAPFTNPQLGFIYATQNYFNIRRDPDDDSVTRRLLIEKAAEGFIIEGKKLSKQKEGEWLAHQLLKVNKELRKKFGNVVLVFIAWNRFFIRKLMNICD
ncbi:hypothetical protein I4U23_004859 [Adineta vaga]|nr:hypothetical protein I4U23_004859 [Adineta vaga]